MSIQIQSKYDPTQPFQVYYTIDMINNDTTGSRPLPAIRFDEIRNSPFLNAPENYFISVVRFSFMSPTLPVFIPQCQLGQNNINLLNYSFTMSYTYLGTTYNYQQYINYIPFDLSQPLPNPPLEFQDLTSGYYYMYSYQQWCSMLNQGLIDCFNGLNAIITGLGGTLPTTNPPFLEFDPQNYIFTLNADELGYASTLPSPISLFANTTLQTILTGFQYIKYGDTGIPNGKNYQFMIYNTNNLNQIILPSYTALQMYQEVSSVALMNPIQSIVFGTTLIPVVPENVSVPKIWGSDSGLLNVGNNSNIAPVLTDFQVPFSPTNTYRPNIEYAPSGEYRLIDLYGVSPLSSVDINIYWKDQFGGLHPMLLGAGCSGNLKLLFRRKDFNTTSLFRTV
jgi:hypothetical protein